MNIAIVGANRGIGLEFVNQLADKHSVYAFCRKASKELSASAAKQVIENCDVSEQASLATAADALEVENLDWLIHVSGIMESTSLENFDVDAIEKQFRVNAIAPILSAKAFLPRLQAGSKIGFLSSRMGSIADNGSGGSYGYRMSKSGLNMAAVSLAKDIQDQEIPVLILHPGYVKTDMTNHNGHIDTKESVEGLIKVMESKTLKDTGTFWHTSGEPLPW